MVLRALCGWLLLLTFVFECVVCVFVVGFVCGVLVCLGACSLSLLYDVLLFVLLVALLFWVFVSVCGCKCIGGKLFPTCSW